MALSVAANADEEAAESLASALARPESAGETETTAVAAIDELVDEASAATAKVEQALTLGKGVAGGMALDPAQLGLEANALLDLLDRLDRQGRAKEALRLARAASKLYSLLRRWLELLRALRAALRAAEKLGDLEAIGWAKHELGTLQLAGDDVVQARRTLSEAREIRKRLVDPRGLAVTEGNLRILSELPPGTPSLEHRFAGARPPVMRLLPLIAIGAVLLGAGLAGGVAVGGSSEETAATVTKTSTQTVTRDGTTVTQPGTTQTVTEPPILETTTVTTTVTEPPLK
jgi:hypothetical protein